MKIVIVTPLYPPDIAAPAPYAKELAKRLSDEHAVTVVAYAEHPELLRNVTVITVSKRTPLPLRMWAFFLALNTALKTADVVLVENGTSVELPVFLASFGKHTPFIAHAGDTMALRSATRNPVRGIIASLFRTRSRAHLTNVPLPRPEILPFAPYPHEALSAYEESWQKHLSLLNNTFYELQR